MFKFQFVNYRLLSQPLVIGLILGIVTVVVAPSIVKKYTVKTSLGLTGNNHLCYYMYPDVRDKVKKPVHLWLDTYTNVCAVENNLNTDDHEIYSRRLIGTMLLYRKPFCGDLDQDGKNEFVYLTTQQDTLFLFIRDVVSKTLKRKVTVIPGFDNEKMLKGDMIYLGVHEKEANGHPVFAFAVGKRLNGVFCYDYLSDDLIEHHPLKKGVGIFNGGKLISKEGKVFYAIRSECLTKELSEFHLLDQDMNLVFSSSFEETRHMYFSRDQRHLVLYHLEAFEYFDLEASLIAKKVISKKLALPEDAQLTGVCADNNQQVFGIFKKDGLSSLLKVSIPDLKASTMKIHNCSRMQKIFYAGDLDENGTEDIITANIQLGEEALIISEAHNGRHAISIPISREQLLVFNVVKKEKGEVLVQSYGTQLRIQYGENPLYVYRWLWYLIIISAYSLIAFIIQFVTKKRQDELYFYKNKMAELQMRNMRDRIDPHFVFNAINSSSSFLLCGDRMEAYNYLSKLSGLLRYSLKNANQVMSPLKDEIPNCRHFLDIQQMRFNNKFEYTLHVDENVSQEVVIPPALLVNLTENSVKHGFNGIDKGGMIKVLIYSKQDGLLIAVEDNGIGRAEASNRKNARTSTGTGTGVIKQYVSLLNSKNKDKVAFTILDLFDEQGHAKGTRCEFFLPDGLTY
ncbi:hypothetical protein DMA11_20455 [Marinilabiliaceae bacterium JC017]|nr:hypothetical protein DMA11_20455 [Marinilabiliaceae bacterium JC017]